MPVNPLISTGYFTPDTVDTLEVYYTNPDGSGRHNAATIEDYPPLDGPDQKGWKATFTNTVPTGQSFLMHVQVTLGSDEQSTSTGFSTSRSPVQCERLEGIS